jgi:hypothetical protein
MSVVLKIDRRRRVVVSTFYGEVNSDELLRHGHEIQADPDFNPDFDEIVDLAAVTRPVFSEETLAKLAANKSVFNAQVRHIIVAPADVAFQLAQKYQALTTVTRPKLFVVRTLSEAYQLLGLDSPGDLRQVS